MAYKRYFTIKGKKYGPYYYESYRDKNGKVKKRYVKEKNKNSNKSEYKIQKKQVQYKKVSSFYKNIRVIIKDSQGVIRYKS